MHDTITVGMVVWFMLGSIGVAAVVGLFVWILSIIASGFNH